MPSLHPPFDALSVGAHALEVNLLGWRQAGTCQVETNSPGSLAMSGSYNALGQKGTFALSLTLASVDAMTSSGACSITVGGRTLEGTCTRNGANLVLSDGTRSIEVSSDPGGVVLAIKGYPKVRIRA